MQHHWNRIAILALALAITTGAATATTLNVPLEYNTIADALAVAQSGDTVLVAPGTYIEFDLMIGAGVHLSGSGPDPESTVIDAQSAGRVLTVLGGDTQVSTLRLTGGDAVRGGGIHVDAGNISLTDLAIDNCHANNGGGVFVAGGQVELLRCTITDNTADSTGGGLQSMQADQVRLDTCLLHGNVAGAMGGAWYIALSQLSLDSCTVEGNRAPNGAEGTAFGPQPVELNHCLTSDNRATTGWSDLQSTLLTDHDSKLQNSCVLRWQNNDDVWSGYLADQLADESLGNLDVYPGFCRNEGSWATYFGLNGNSPAQPVDGGCGLRGAYGEACAAVGTPDVPVLVDQLLPAYPNPFNPSTNIKFAVAESGRVTLNIYGLDGRRVARLVNDDLTAGQHQATWLGHDDRGRSMASGVYLARLVTPTSNHAIRLTLVK